MRGGFDQTEDGRRGRCGAALTRPKMGAVVVDEGVVTAAGRVAAVTWRRAPKRGKEKLQLKRPRVAGGRR